ncbi:hypothetical protein C0J50_23587 [Silurus asotus]|uniref:Uncharacterized protein n=1 Tax=Silurus asotus TaxID=30991 RepID=A0AAD5AID2_SILAS|nr:hypothetical protein C0J50_23587 [Silurus asotus]
MRVSKPRETSESNSDHETYPRLVKKIPREQVLFRWPPKKERKNKKVNKSVQKEQMEQVKPSAPEEPVTTLRSSPGDQQCEPVTPTRSKWRHATKVPLPPRAKPPKKADPETDLAPSANSVQDEADQEIITRLFGDISVDSLTPTHSMCNDMVNTDTDPELKSEQSKEKPHRQIRYGFFQRKEAYKRKVNKVVQMEQMEPVKPSAPEEPVTTLRSSPAWKHNISILGDQPCEPVTPTRPKWRHAMKVPLSPRATPLKKADPETDFAPSANSVEDEADQEIITSLFGDISVDSLTLTHSTCNDMVNTYTDPELNSEQSKEKPHRQIRYGFFQRKEDYKRKVNKVVQMEQMEPVKPSAPEEPVTTLQSSPAWKHNISILGDQPCEPVTPTRPKWRHAMKVPLPPRATPLKKADPETDFAPSANSVEDEADQEIITSLFGDISVDSLTLTHSTCNDMVNTDTDPELKSEQSKKNPHRQIRFGVFQRKEDYKRKVNKVVQKGQMDPSKPVTTLRSSSAWKHNTSIMYDQQRKPVSPTRPKWSDVVKASLRIATPPKKSNDETVPASAVYSVQKRSVHTAVGTALESMKHEVKSNVQVWQSSKRKRKKNNAVVVL